MINMNNMKDCYSDITYLDENGNFATKDNYYRSIITVYKDGKIVEEVFSYNPDQMVAEENDKDYEVEILYVNDEGVEVPEKEATYCITKIFKDGKLVGDYKNKLYKGPITHSQPFVE